MSEARRRSLLSRADLAAALARTEDGQPGGDALFIAEALRLDWQPPLPPAPEPATLVPRLEPGEPAPPDVPVQALDSVLFWRAELLEWFDEAEAPPEPPPTGPAYRAWRQAPAEPPPFQPLAPWAELAPKLRKALSGDREGRAIDLPRTLRAVAEGRSLSRLPRERRRRWGAPLYLVEDHSRRLIPFRADKRLVRQRLRTLLPGYAFVRCLLDDSHDRPEPLTPGAAWPPPPGAPVLAIGDLGALARAGAGIQALWEDLGRELRDAGCRPVALFPGPLERCPPTLAELWQLIPWERPRGHDGRDPQQRTLRLLRLAACASRLEPGLLRALRRLLPEDQADAGTEADVWQHPALATDGAVIAGFEPATARTLRDSGPPESLDLRRRLARTLRPWRRDLPLEIWFAELMNFDRDILPGEGADDLTPDLEDARAYFQHFCDGHPDPVHPAMPGYDRDWLNRIAARSSPALWQDPHIGRPLAELALAVARDTAPLPGVDIAQIPHRDRPERGVALVQAGGELALAAPGADAGSFLALLRSRNGWVEIREIEAPGSGSSGDEFWEGGVPPTWADAWGWDEYGAWVEFSVQGKDGARVSQRMRWIAPGRFMMGSPDDEPERYDDEGPRHEVTLREGFWLFDTACTQALWEAVMGRNPSHFQGPDRPVERVSWDDAHRFIEQLNAWKPDLGLSLPSEAHWEFACRAGTQTPFSFGATITPEQVNYDGNHPYAGGAKGPYRRQTVPVKSLPPNAWGLFEMHGNVWEWVRDAWHPSYRGAPIDGAAWEAGPTGADRVIRGGSWVVDARDCRSAYRGRDDPGFRGAHLGFRCARVQESESGRQAGASGARGAEAARPAERIRPGGAGAVARSEPRPLTPRKGGWGEGALKPLSPRERGWGEGALLRLDRAGLESIPLPGADASSYPPRKKGAGGDVLGTTLTATTDRHRLSLRRYAKPAWARAMGRDRYGLWADLAVEPPAGGPPAVQRLRWIPPGRFRMGSPDGEPGRWGDEGPQQLITLAAGYWLFDTPCTQALWAALLGDNPSRFQDPHRPVEQVSWRDIHDRFLPALNDYFERFQAGDPGRFALPSEAQWEYACRSGTETALYTGPLEILGDMNAPALDPIAWYGGNSGHRYDLDEGEDSTAGWWQGREKQFPHTKAGTRRVRGKAANPWGLYDMLGNVWEWTEDAWQSSHEGADPDGRPRAGEAGAGRVIRGGSWDDVARLCRSASRIGYDPDDRVYHLGFRCARVQA